MFRILSTVAFLFCLCGCFSPGHTDSLQQHTADATAAAKRDAGAIARGVAEGLARKDPLNINTASIKQLTTLPGITPDLATVIVSQRPYSSTRDLVHKRIISISEFNRVKGQIVVE